MSLKSSQKISEKVWLTGTLLSVIRGVHGLESLKIYVDSSAIFRGKCLRPNIQVSIIVGLDKAKFLVPLINLSIDLTYFLALACYINCAHKFSLVCSTDCIQMIATVSKRLSCKVLIMVSRLCLVFTTVQIPYRDSNNYKNNQTITKLLRKREHRIRLWTWFWVQVGTTYRDVICHSIHQKIELLSVLLKELT